MYHADSREREREREGERETERERERERGRERDRERERQRERKREMLNGRRLRLPAPSSSRSWFTEKSPHLHTYYTNCRSGALFTKC
jgi:hypothetical protein